MKTIIQNNPEYAPLLKNKVEEMNDIKFATSLLFSYIFTDNEVLAKELISSYSLDTSFSEIVNNISLNNCNKVLQFAKANLSSELQDIVTAKQESLERNKKEEMQQTN